MAAVVPPIQLCCFRKNTSLSYPNITSSLVHTQFAYATVNHDLNSCSNPQISFT